MENGLIPAINFKGPVHPDENTTSQLIWNQLRGPFLLPVNGCVKCTDWEMIQFGIVGCRTCGSFHICSFQRCIVTEIENHHVCNITGCVVKTLVYDLNEYVTTVSRDLPNRTTSTKRKSVMDGYTGDGASKPIDDRVTKLKKNFNVLLPNKRHSVSRCLNFHERVCMRVLCSNAMVICFEKEQLKLHNRLRWSFMRNVKSLKMERRPYHPNLIIMISKVAKDIENYRLPITNDTIALRKDLVYRCAQDIYKFTSSMILSKAVFTSTIDPSVMIIGLLYLMRSGLVHNNITILPQYRELSHLLPPENFMHLFNVKSKIITITENIVKCHLRTLSIDEIKEIGYETLDI
jgi:hypothetical protein